MSNATKLRGESEIVLGGQTLKLKASVESLINIEDRLATDLITLLTGISAVKLPFKTISVLLHEFHSAAGGKLSFKECAKLLLENGYARNSPPLLNLLGEAVMAGKDESTGTQEGGDPS